MKKVYIILFAVLLITSSTYSQTIYTLNWGTSFSPAWGAPGTSGNCTNIGGSGVNATVAMVSTGGAGTFTSPYPRVNGAGDFVVAGSSSAIEIDMNFATRTETMTTTFTFNQPVSGVKISISDIDKNNAASTAYFDSVVISGSDGSNTILPTLTKFNAASNFTTINGNAAHANLTSGQGGNASSTAMDATSQQCTVIVDFGSSVITSFTILYGNPAAAQANPILQAIAFGNITFSKTISVSGTVWNDVNGSAAGGFTGIQNGGETGTSGSGLNANLVDVATGKIIATIPVNADGTYSFPNVAQNLNVSVQLSTTAGTFGNAAPATGTFSNWTNTSPLAQPFNTGVAGTNITGKDFGIERPPTALIQTYNISQPVSGAMATLNGTGAFNSPGPLSGSDPDDGPLGSGNTFNIVSLAGMNGNKLFYNGIEITGPTSISNYNPALLQVQYTANGSTGLSFTYASVDAAGKASTAASYSIGWLLPLPLQVMSVRAELNGTIATVNWKTENEINISRFFVERSIDNINFVAAGDLATAGNYTGIKNYSLQNDISGLTVNPVIYYRIRVVDIDGKITYSNTVAVRLSNLKGIIAWPNPITDNVTIALYSSVNTNVEVRIMDVAGKTVTAANYNIVKGNNQINITNLARMAQGVYMLQVKDKNGNTQFVQKLIK